MAGKWGDWENDCRVGFFYDSIEMNSGGTQARVKGGRIRFESRVNVSDQTNTLSWKGGAVPDSSSSNKKLSGKGQRTIQSVSGSWVTLNTVNPVYANAEVSFSGVNYAGATLKAKVSVKYPVAGDGGTVSPIPSPGGDAYPNPWEDADAPDWATEPYVEHIYAVRLPNAPSDMQNVPAWDITVDMDGGRSPFASATFKAPLSFLTDDNYSVTNPRLNPIVQIDAGWKYPGARNIHTLFSGIISDRRLKVDETGAYVQFTAESYETILEYPANVGRAVNNAWTTIGEFFSGSSFYRVPNFVEYAGNVAPDTPALTEYRAMECTAGDDLSDFMRACAAALNQWVRGSMTSSVPTIECLSDPYPYQRLVELDVNAFESLERVENLDNWANIMKLTVQWTSGDSTVNKTRTYYASSVGSGSGAVRSRDVTMSVKPPSGAVPSATWAPALRWVRRVNEASRGSWQGTCRALWWLQPRLDGVLLRGNPLEDTGGQIQKVTFLVDQGLMSVTWNVVHP